MFGSAKHGDVDENGNNFGFDWMLIGDSEIKGNVNYTKNMD